MIAVLDPKNVRVASFPDGSCSFATSSFSVHSKSQTTTVKRNRKRAETNLRVTKGRCACAARCTHRGHANRTETHRRRYPARPAIALGEPVVAVSTGSPPSTAQLHWCGRVGENSPLCYCPSGPPVER